MHDNIGEILSRLKVNRFPSRNARNFIQPITIIKSAPEKHEEGKNRGKRNEKEEHHSQGITFLSDPAYLWQKSYLFPSQFFQENKLFFENF